MKLLVRKLGLIDHAELDIRPLTVLIGENGTNKTWVAYSLYGLMRSMVRSGASSLPVHALGDADRSALERIQAEYAAIPSSLAQAGSRSMSLEFDFSKFYPEGPTMSALVGKAPFLSHLLRLPEGFPADAESRLEFDSSEYRAKPKPVRISIESPAGSTMLMLKVLHIISQKEDVTVANSIDTLLLADGWEHTLSTAFESWLSQSLGNVFVLPAERKTLASAHDLLRDEFGKVVTVPVADYAEFLGSRRRLAVHGAEPAGESPFGDLVGLLEGKVVKGAIGFKRDGAGAGGDARQPGPPGGDDDHSPYIVDHLNNLMAAARVPPRHQDELVPHFKLESREAFLPADKVAAYHFAPVDGKVEVRDVLDRETEAIDWRTFSRVTDELSNLYGRILDAKERQ